MENIKLYKYEKGEVKEVKEILKAKGNGYYVYTIECPKCHGTGILPHFLHHDDGICYRCMGSGTHTKEGKLYTKEVAQRKADKYIARKLKEQEKYNRTYLDREEKSMLEYLHINNVEDKLYIIDDDKSYELKENLKEVGYRFLRGYWIGNKKVDNINSIETTFKTIYDRDNTDLINLLKFVKDNTTIKQSEYVGIVGDKMEIELNVYSIIPVEGNWGTNYIYLMKDSKNNHYKWVASTCRYSTGNYKVKGTIKAHKEYNGTKQTVLTRCKLK